jgi:hypothetical protein
MRFKHVSVLLLVVAALIGMRFGGPSVALADPSGTISPAIVHTNQAIHISVKGLAPNSLLTVSVSTSNGSPVKDPGQPTFVDPSGSMDILVYPYIVTPAGYGGPLFITVCDSNGNCVNFNATVRGDRIPEPIAVGSAQNHGFEADCAFLTRISKGQINQTDVREWLLRQDMTYLELLVANCGFTSAQQNDTTFRIFEFVFGDVPF